MKRLSIRKLLIIAIIVYTILCGVLYFTNNASKGQFKSNKISESSIKQICELATLECYYHNVSEWNNPGGFLHPGKKLWLEYDGVIRVGIKAEEVMVSDPDKDNTITITIPKASVLSIDLDEESIYEIDSESPLWGFIPIYGSVSIEERKDALAEAQRKMESDALKNETILIEAQVRAKMIFENNIIALGNAIGKNYTVNFIDASETTKINQSEDIQSN